MEIAEADGIDGKPKGEANGNFANQISAAAMMSELGAKRLRHRLLNDFAGNASVLIKQIDGAHPVIAVCDDEFQMGWISDEQQRRKLLAGRDCHMIFPYVIIGYPQ